MLLWNLADARTHFVIVAAALPTADGSCVGGGGLVVPVVDVGVALADFCDF